MFAPMKFYRLRIPALRRVQIDHRVMLLLIALMAFALRVYHLGAQAIWWDESLSLYRATRDLATILANTIVIQNVVTTDLQPPLYFILLHFLVPAFGTSEFALRFLSLAANVLTIPLLYDLGRQWLSRGAGLLAALFGTLAPFYVWFAQEARPYALVLLWSLLALCALTRAFALGRADASTREGFLKQLDSIMPRVDGSGETLTDAGKTTRPSAFRARRWLLVYILAAIAALYTHYYAIFLFPFHSLFVAARVWPSAWKFIFLPVLPLASAILLIPKAAAGAAGNANSGPTFVPLDIIFRDLVNSFSIGLTLDPGQAAWVDALLGAVFLIGIAASVSIPSGRAGIFLLAYLFIPTLELYVASYVRPLYQNSRYLIAWSPAFYLGIAAGVLTLARRSRLLAVPALGVFLIGATVSLSNLYFDPRFGKDDHRAWAEFLRERVRPGDFLILDSPHTAELYHYYAGDLLPWTTLPILRDDGVASPQEDLAAVREVYRRYARVWFLSMHAPFDDPEGRIEKILNQEGALLDRATFRGTSTGILLLQYVPSLPIASANEIGHPLNAMFDSRLRLLGYDAPASIESGARGVVKLYWQVDEPVGEDYGVSLRVVDDTGARWGQWDAVPLGNRAGSSTWAAKKIMVDAHDLPIDPGTRPGTFHLQIQVYRPATGAAMGSQSIGDISITRPRRPINPETLRLTHRFDQTFTGLRMLGADMPNDIVHPGDVIAVSIYFQILQKPRVDFPIALQLIGHTFPWIDSGTVRADAKAVIFVHDLEIGDIVRQDLPLNVPADANGDYDMRAKFTIGDGLTQTIDLGRARVQPITHSTALLPISHPQSAHIGDMIDFLGYDLGAARVRAGDTIRLTLYWRAQKTMDTSYKVFTHVIDSNNQIFGQQDSIPVSGSRPTTGWVPGEVIADSYAITLGDATPPGKYQVEIGFYDAASGVRLPIFDVNGTRLGDRILLQDLEVQ